MNTRNTAIITSGIVLGGVLFTLLVGWSVQVGAQRYAERFSICVSNGGTWVPTGDTRAACVRP